MIYWKSDKFWLGRLREFPDIMTQGRTLKELEENLRDAYQLMMLDDVPADYALKEITVEAPCACAAADRRGVCASARWRSPRSLPQSGHR